MVGVVVFEENGIPVELFSAREIERAVSSGRMRADTLVRTGFEENDPRIAAAGEIAWLRPFLGMPDPVEPPLPTPVPAAARTPSPPVAASRPLAATASAGLVQTKNSNFWQPPTSAPAHSVTSTATTEDTTTEDTTSVPRSPRPASAPSASYHEPDTLLGRGFIPLLRYATFTGRSSPREFWTFMILQSAALFLLAVLGTGTTGVGLAAVALVVPNVAVAVRRCHDQNRTGWLVFVCILPYVGWLILVVLMMISGTSGPNRFGVNPMGRR